MKLDSSIGAHYTNFNIDDYIKYPFTQHIIENQEVTR